MSVTALLRRYYYAAAGGGGESLVACSAATGSLFDEFVQATDAEFYNLLISNDAAGQSWLSDSSPGEVTGACVRLRKIGAPTGTMRVSIYAHSGTYGSSGVPTGSALVSSASYDVSELTTSYANYFFPLSGWTPDPSTAYFVVLEGVSWSGDGSNFVRITKETGAEADHAGNAAVLVTSSVWGTTGGGAEDMAFKIYETTTPVTGVARAATFIRNAIRIGF